MGIHSAGISVLQSIAPKAFHDNEKRMPSGITRVIIDMNASMRMLPPCKKMLLATSSRSSSGNGSTAAAVVMDHEFVMTRHDLLERFQRYLGYLWKRYPDALTFVLVYDKRSPKQKTAEQSKRIKSRETSDKKHKRKSMKKYTGLAGEEEQFTIHSLMSASYAARAKMFAWLAHNSSQHVANLNKHPLRKTRLVHDYSMCKNHKPIIVNTTFHDDDDDDSMVSSSSVSINNDNTRLWANNVFEGEVASVMHAMTKWRRSHRHMRAETIAVESVDTDTMVIMAMHVLRLQTQQRPVYQDDQTSDDEMNEDGDDDDDIKTFLWVRSSSKSKKNGIRYVDMSHMCEKFRQFWKRKPNMRRALFLALVICKNDFCPDIKSRLAPRINPEATVRRVMEWCSRNPNANPIGNDADMCKMIYEHVRPFPKAKQNIMRKRKAKTGEPTKAAMAAKEKYDNWMIEIRSAVAATRSSCILPLWLYWETFHIKNQD